MRLRRRILNYAEAVAEWTAAGCPTRTAEDTETIFRIFCRPCFFHDKTKHACRECGCRITPTGTAIVNKIRMATQHCPIGRW
jgi:hypothetical protein